MSSDLLDPSVLKIFNHEEMRTNDEVEHALQVIANVDHTVWKLVVQECLERSLALEFVWTGISEEAYELRMRDWNWFFADATDTFPGSLAARVLQRILIGLRFMDDLMEKEDRLFVKRNHFFVPHTSTVLSAVVSSDIDAMLRARSRVRTTRGISLHRLDNNLVSRASEPFSEFAHVEAAITALGHHIPDSHDKWNKLAGIVMKSARDVWVRCMLIARSPGLAAHFRMHYLQELAHEGSNTALENGQYVVDIAQSLSMTAAKSFGPWKVLLAPPAKTYLKKERQRSAKHAEIAVRKMRDLSHGDFTPDNQKRLEGFRDLNADIYSAWITGDTRLIYCIDCVEDVDSQQGLEVQAIVILNIVTHAQMDKRLQVMVASQLTGRSERASTRCKKRQLSPSTGRYQPVTFPKLETYDLYSQAKRLPVDPDVNMEAHELIGMRKYVMLSQAFINGLLADPNTTLPFIPSCDQLEVIRHPSSSYVIGRSGTGKTTAIVFKMLVVEHASRMSHGTLRKPRQIFLTKSPELAKRVEKYYHNLNTSLNAGSLSPEELVGIHGRSHSEERWEVLPADERQKEHDDLPASFNLLNDTHFPLFVTSEKLFALLEADAFSARTLHSPKKHEDATYTIDGRAESPRRLTYTTFLVNYWRHFPSSLTRGFDSASIYNQFLAVLRGSEAALETKKGSLDRQTYVHKLSRSTRATFSVEQDRDRIFDLFEKYLHKLMANNEQDDAGRTRNLLKALECGCGIKRRVDFLYVDEVQDILLVDALVFRSICSNTAGLFWTGDTAQTVSAGSTFQFAELKAFMYRAEEALNQHGNHGADPPTQFQLRINRRSHMGITRVAASIVKILLKLWPNQIDDIGEEMALDPGHKPFFVSTGFNGTNTLMDLLRESGTAHLDFGAHQCILVRDDDAKHRIKKIVGDKGLVQTIVESKGLEFQDVLLVDFFQDSNVSENTWRKMMNTANMPDYHSQEDYPVQSMCLELKHLYVAVTRACFNLVILDSSTTATPVKALWQRLGMIETHIPLGGIRARGDESSTRDWEALARTLCERNQFDDAAWAFDKADQPHEAADARAYALEQEALKTFGNNLPNAVQLLETAGDSLVQRAYVARRRVPQLILWDHGAACYQHCGRHTLAAETYLLAENYGDAARQFLAGRNYPRSLEIIRNSRSITQSLLYEVMQACRMHYVSGKKFHRAKQLQLFDSVSELIAFIDASPELQGVKAEAYESEGLIDEAADLYMSGKEPYTIEQFEGRGIMLLLSDPANMTRMSKLASHIMGILHVLMSFGVTSVVVGSHIRKARLKLLLDATHTMHEHPFSSKERRELVMFEAMLDSDQTTLRRVLEEFLVDKDCLPQGMICLDHILGLQPSLHEYNKVEIIAVMKLLYIFGLRMEELAASPTPLKLAPMFGVSLNKLTFRYQVPKGTFLSEWVSVQPKHRVERYQKIVWSSVPQEDTAALIAAALRNRANHRLSVMMAQPLKAMHFRPLPHGPRSLVDPEHNLSWRKSLLPVYHQSAHVLSVITVHEPNVVESWIQAVFQLVVEGPGAASCMAEVDFRSQGGGSIAITQLIALCRTVIETMPASPVFLVRFAQVLVLHKCFKRPLIYFDNPAGLGLTPRPATLEQAKQGVYAAQYLCEAMFSKRSESRIMDSMAFLQQVILYRIPLDLVWLCHFIATLCIAVCVTWKYQATQSFHLLVGPRLCLLEVMEDLATSEFVPMRRTVIDALFDRVAGFISVLLKRNNRQPFHVHNIEISKVDQNVKDLFVESLYASLRIVALNVEHTGICEMVGGYWHGSLSSMIQDDVVVLLDTRDPGHKATCQKYQHQGIHPVLYTQRTEISQLLKQKPPPVRGPPRAKSGPAAGRRLEKPSIVSPLKSPSTSSKRVVPRLAAPIASTFAVGDARPAWPLEPVIELVSQTLKWEGSAIEVDSPVPAVNPTIRTLRTLQAWLDGLSSDDVVRLSKLSSIHRRFADRTTSIAPPPTMTAEGEERRQAFATFHTLSKAWAQPITPMFQRMYCGAAPHAYHAASFIMKWTEKEKKDAKKEFMQGIEGASQRRLRASQILKRASVLNNDLRPTSDLFRPDHGLQIRDTIGKLHTLVTEIPISVANIIMWDVEIAFAAAVKYTLLTQQ